MKQSTLAKFWRHYHDLPVEVQALANKNFELLKANPQHPSLHFKRIGSLWSVRIGRDYRALGLDKSGHVMWF